MNSWFRYRSQSNSLNYVGSAFFAVSSNLFTIAVQIVAGRSLSLAALSAFITAWTLCSLVALATSGVQTTTAIQVSKSQSWRFRHLEKSISRIGIDQFTRKISLIAIVASIASLSLTPLIADSLHIERALYIVACLSVLPQALFAIATGRLQGRYQFLIMNTFGAATTFVRLIATVIVLRFATSAEAIIITNVAVTLVLALFCLVREKSNYIPSNEFSLWIAGRATTILLVFWSLFYLDIFISRLAPHGTFYESYAAASTLAKSILIPVVFLTSSLIPKIASGSLGQNRYVKSQKMHMANLGFASVVAIFIWLFSYDLTYLLIGQENFEVALLLRMLSISFLPYAVIYSIINRNLALGNGVSVTLLVIPAAIGACIFVLFEISALYLPVFVFIIGIVIVTNLYLQQKFLNIR
jgi:hypothetical protein